jgi:hypothetical protein
MEKKIFLMLCALAVMAASVSAQEEPIGFLFKDKIKSGTPVKVYIKEVKNESGNSQVTAEVFTAALEQSLRARRSIKFEVTGDESGSDIAVTAVIKGYRYMEKGPLKPAPNVVATFADAAATASQNYADMQAEFTVSDAKNGKVLWSKTLDEYIKKKMAAGESVSLICGTVTKAFVWKCFGKAGLRESDRQRP